MLTITNLAHRFATDTALQLDAWSADRGERWLIAGPSGSGKTTLLSILAGLLRPTQGTVRVGEHEISAMSEAALDAWRGGNVGYVPQRLHLIDSLNVRDNLQLAQYLGCKRVTSAAAHSLLRALDIEAFALRFPHELSQGQAQRVAVARAVINGPGLLLADEPTAALDDVQAERAIALLFERATAVGATLVVASHDARIGPAFDHRLALTIGSGT